MTRGGRISVLVLALAGAAGWLSGLVLLPLAAWVAMEALVELHRRLAGGGLAARLP
jgi:hypothetical protein